MLSVVMYCILTLELLGGREARVWPFFKKMRLLLDLSLLHKKKKEKKEWLISLHLLSLARAVQNERMAMRVGREDR